MPDETADVSDSTINLSQRHSVSEKKPSIPGYDLEEKLGEGAFGAVYKSVQKSTGQSVAVKVLTRVNTRFRDEVARLTSVSEHPHIVTLVDAQLDHQPPYFVTPLLSGSLADQVPATPKDANIEQVCTWFSELARALEYIHGCGILHCDLKPANVLVGEKGFARLTDFGQATLAQEETSRLGSFWYMPMKQTKGEIPHVSWDLYALGATIYTLLTGRPPRSTAQARETLQSRSTVSEKITEYQKVMEEARLVPVRELNPEVDRELASIVEYLLDEEAGYAGATELLRDLERRNRNLPLSCRPLSFGYWFERLFARHKLSVLVGVSALLILLAGFGYSSYEVYKARQARAVLIQQNFERGISQLESGQATGLIWLLRAYRLEPREEFRTALLQNLAQQRQIVAPFLYKLRTATAPSPSGHWAIWRDPDENLEKKLVDLETGATAPLPAEIFGSNREQKDRVRYRLDGVELEPEKGRGGPATWRMRSSESLQPSEEAAALAIWVGEEETRRAVRTANGLAILDQTDEVLLDISRQDGIPVQPTFSLQADVAVSWENAGSTWYNAEQKVVMDDESFYSDLFCFSKDGKLLAGCDGVSKVRVWDEKGETVAEFSITSAANEMAFDPTGKVLVCATRDGLVHGFDIQAKERAWPPIELEKAARWLYVQESGNVVTMSDVVVVWGEADGLDSSLTGYEELKREVERRTGWTYDAKSSKIRTLTREEYLELF